MAKDEVQLGNMDDDDYEVIPLGPIRKLERRVENLQEQQEKAEASGGAGGSANEELVRDILDIMKSNQKIVNDMTESTHELRNSVEDLTNKMDSVIDNMNEFMDLLNQASEMDMEGEVAGDIETRVANAIGDKMDDMVEEVKSSNEKIADNLNDLNTEMRKTYYSNSDSGGGVANQSRPGQGQQQQQGGSGQRSSGGRSRNQNSGGGLNMGSDKSNRMENLRDKFKSQGNNE
jgi:hypothetical protein